MIYATIYKRLARLLPNLATMQPGESFTLKSGAYMDLHVDVMSRDGDSLYIALAHRYTQNGDTMADPDMEVRVMFGMGMAEALKFSQDGMFARRQWVYGTNEQGQKTVNPRAKTELNSFLAQWLMNLHHQGHKLDQKEAA